MGGCADVKIYWHPQGDYLAIKVDRFTKTKKSTYTSFELFSVKERDFPMEVLELPNKAEKVVDFAWEPKVRTLATRLTGLLAGVLSWPTENSKQKREPVL